MILFCIPLLINAGSFPKLINVGLTLNIKFLYRDREKTGKFLEKIRFINKIEVVNLRKNGSSKQVVKKKLTPV